MRVWGIFIVFVSIILAVGLPGGISQAQNDATETCNTLINGALANLGNNCANLEQNSICYGYNSVYPTFMNENQLIQPADRVGLLGLITVETAPFNVLDGEWGISVMNVQANLPSAYSDEAVKYILMGDVRIEDETMPEKALMLPGKPVEVIVAADSAELYESPLDFGVTSISVVGDVAAGTTFQADGMSPSGQWLRVAYEFENIYGRNVTAWVKRERLGENREIDSLPTIGPVSYTPMQAFYFSTAMEQSECENAPPSHLLVQSPNGVETDIKANGAHIRINSTIMLQAFPSSKFMRIAVISGFARVYPGTPDELLIPAGYTATICLEGPYNVGSDDQENDYVIGDSCNWSVSGRLTQEFLTTLEALENIPGNILNYPISVPILVCASGLSALCEYRYEDARYSATLTGLCEEGRIPADICQSITPDVIVIRESEDCQAVANRMVTGIDSNCANLAPDSICYASVGVETNFADDIQLVYPADRADAQTFVTAENVPFSALEDVWGAIVMNISAGLPPTATDGSVNGLLFGESRIENGVNSEVALILPDAPVEVVTKDTGEVFSYPEQFILYPIEVVGEINGGQTLQADGITEDKAWVRVAFDYETDYGHMPTAWVLRELLEDNAAIDTLPFIGHESYTPMQSFYFETVGDQEACVEVPPAYLLLQSPEDVEIKLNVNRTDIRINATVLLQAFPQRSLMRLITLTGVARVHPNTSHEVVIPAGYTAITCLNGPFSNGADGDQNDYIASANCEWRMAGQLSEDALALFAAVIPGEVFNYPVYLPELVCDGDVCEYVDTNPAYQDRIARLCEQGKLSESICQFANQ